MTSTHHDYDWDAVREQFSIPPDVVYLNNGSFGPAPRPVVDATVKYLKLVETNPHVQLRSLEAEVDEAKKKLGTFVGAKAEDLVFCTNVTVGTNMVARGLKTLKAGDTVLTTDQEYGAVDNAWEFLAERRGLNIVRAAIPTPPESEDEIVEAVAGKLDERVKLLFFSHITTQTGLIMPVKRLCSLAAERGIMTAIDGAHAPGMIPLNIRDLGCTFYLGNCHKWLCAVKGVGFLYAAPEAHELLDPLVAGWGWQRGQETLAGNLQSVGTYNPSIYAGVGAAVDFQQAIGKRRIAARGRHLSRYARGILSTLPGAKALTPSGARLSCSMATYLFPPADQTAFRSAIERHQIIVPGGCKEDGLRIRVSTHLYNDEGDLDLLRHALGELY